jgi:hypothetical protein
LFALNVGFAPLAITAACLEPLADLPHLGWLVFAATDEAMPYGRVAPPPLFDVSGYERRRRRLRGAESISYDRMHLGTPVL